MYEFIFEEDCNDPDRKPWMELYDWVWNHQGSIALDHSLPNAWDISLPDEASLLAFKLTFKNIYDT